MADYIFLLETRLSPEQQSLIHLLQRLSRGAGLNLYLTGGPMRDLLAAKPVLYLNFTTESSPLALAKPLAAEGAARITSSTADQTLRFSYHNIPVRIGAARATEEGKSGRRGFVPGTVVEDLRSRGLTLNSVGLSLNQGSLGLLLDPTNGAGDIEARAIRMNHPYVFLEQPVMLLRAVRLRQRLGFTIEERTETRMQIAREANYIAQLDHAALGSELEAIAYEPDPAAAVTALEQEGWLEAAMGKGVRTSKMNLGLLSQLGEALQTWGRIGAAADAGLVAMPALLDRLPGIDQNRLTQSLASSHLSNWKTLTKAFVGFEKRLLTRQIQSPIQIQDLVQQANADEVVYAALAPSNVNAGKKLKEFLARAQQAHTRVPRAALRNAGIDPETEEGRKVCDYFYRRFLQGELKQDNELADEVKQRILVLRPPPPPPEPKSKAAAKAAPAKNTSKAATAAAASGAQKTVLPEPKAKAPEIKAMPAKTAARPAAKAPTKKAVLAKANTAPNAKKKSAIPSKGSKPSKRR